MSIDSAPIIHAVEQAADFALRLAWSIIDALVFVELENPLAEVAVFIAALSVIAGAGFAIVKRQGMI